MAYLSVSRSDNKFGRFPIHLDFNSSNQTCEIDLLNPKKESPILPITIIDQFLENHSLEEIKQLIFHSNMFPYIDSPETMELKIVFNENGKDRTLIPLSKKAQMFSIQELENPLIRKLLYMRLSPLLQKNGTRENFKEFIQCLKVGDKEVLLAKLDQLSYLDIRLIQERFGEISPQELDIENNLVKVRKKDSEAA